MTSALPTAAEQFGAALSAPLPFFLALLAVAIVIWRCMEWRYGGIIEIWKARHGQAVGEFETALRRQDDLIATIEKLESQVETLREKAKDVPQLQETITDLSDSTATAGNQLDRLTRANEWLSEFFKAPAGDTGSIYNLHVIPRRSHDSTLRPSENEPKDE